MACGPGMRAWLVVEYSEDWTEADAEVYAQRLRETSEREAKYQEKQMEGKFPARIPRTPCGRPER
jgi:hypothetical protein